MAKLPASKAGDCGFESHSGYVECKDMGPYAVDLPFEFGHFLLLAMLVGIGMGVSFMKAFMFRDKEK
jgi:hypothetical protein